MKKRKDGRYQKNVQIGYHPDGRRKFKTIYGNTQQEVKNEERELKSLIDSGAVISDETTLSQWSLKWLKVYQHEKTYNTKEMYRNSIEKHIIPSLGDIPISKIRPIQIREAINDLIDAKKYRTAEIFQLTINQLLACANNEGLLNRIVKSNVKIPKQDSKSRVLTNIELKAIKETTFDAKQRLFLNLLLFTGMRRGEVLALDIFDFDMKENTVNVRKNLIFKGNDSEISSPKTKAGYRIIKIPQFLMDDIKQFIGTNTILFVGQNGKHMSRSSFRRFWDKIIKQINEYAKEDCLEVDFTPHTFRHTYATNLYYAGVDVKTAQYLLGHSTLQVTLEIYTHLDRQKISTQNDSVIKFIQNLTA